MKYQKVLKVKFKRGELLKKHTSLRIGGPVRYFVEPASLPDLKAVLTLLGKKRMPVLILGSGSNILVKDRGVDSAVIRMSRPCFKKALMRGNHIEVGSAMKIAGFLKLSAGAGLCGGEFLSGIPGTIGGALMMNAGCWGSSISDIVEKVRVMDYNGRIKELQKRECKFAYRTSGLNKYIILGAVFRLKPAGRTAIIRKISAYLRQRKEQQGLVSPSAGCVFKNPSGKRPAGLLIDQCGLKGKRVGGACISTKHANFILNMGKARATDVLNLMDLARKAVKRKFNITLEPEIKIW